MNVARGWESKGVEAQIEEGKQREEESTRVKKSMEARRLVQRLEALRLSRARVLEQLERARHNAHREILMKGLRALEEEMEQISPEGKKA